MAVEITPIITHIFQQSYNTFAGHYPDNCTLQAPPTENTPHHPCHPPQPVPTRPQPPPSLMCTFPHPPHPNPIFPSTNTLIPLPDNIKPAILKPTIVRDAPVGVLHYNESESEKTSKLNKLCLGLLFLIGVIAPSVSVASIWNMIGLIAVSRHTSVVD